ncbi:hypothetical protein [Aquamicrobium zhengzhouense]|uniref:Uncharacterized protein n=1 Tax=Aquamicrobium zhengzhouense TaxID=2781738 RepID=A0ABS0SDX5_9HYPH|nr:hypothetical protein [Aquamicrobium zhengzhouense]MBI1621499.1 hypothetical protein [Aquamicrobium zhengzhouense]
MSWDFDPVVTFRDLADEISSPKAKSQRLAAFAKEKIAEADAINRNALGRDVDREVYVDGSAGRAIEQVSPDGVVFAEWSMIGSVLEWIGEELLLASPILTGKYMRSHILFVDDVEHQPGTPLNEAASEYAFVNKQPYARKIERGQSPQAPDGVYEVIASLASRRFGNQARIRYSFRSLTGTKDRTDRQPAIIVYPR